MMMSLGQSVDHSRHTRLTDRVVVALEVELDDVDVHWASPEATVNILD